MRTLASWLLIGALFTATMLVLDNAIEPTHAERLEFLVYGIAVPTTLFVLIYGLTSPWWTTMIGRALLVSSTALALLVDLSLISNWWHITLPDWMVLGVFGLIFAGAWLKLAALAGQKWAAHVERRSSDAR